MSAGKIEMLIGFHLDACYEIHILTRTAFGGALKPAR